MRALIIFDPTHTTNDQIAQTTAGFMTAQAQVRLVSVKKLQAPDFDGINIAVMACPQTPFAPAIQNAYETSLHNGMRTLSLQDADRMLWFRNQKMKRAQ